MDTLQLAIDVINAEIQDWKEFSHSYGEMFALRTARETLLASAIVATFAGACRAAAARLSLTDRLTGSAFKALSIEEQTRILIRDGVDPEDAKWIIRGYNWDRDDNAAPTALPSASGEDWVTRSGDSIKVGDVLRWTPARNRTVVKIETVPGAGYRKVWLDALDAPFDEQFYEFFDGDAYDVLMPVPAPAQGAPDAPQTTGEAAVCRRCAEPLTDDEVLVNHDICDQCIRENVHTDKEVAAAIAARKSPAPSAKPVKLTAGQMKVLKFLAMWGDKGAYMSNRTGQGAYDRFVSERSTLPLIDLGWVVEFGGLGKVEITDKGRAEYERLSH